MGWFKTLASRSYLEGRTASDFAIAAQRNADAFWWPLLLSAIVWWLASWKWALIPLGLAIWLAFKSVSATLIKQHLEKIEADLK